MQETKTCGCGRSTQAGSEPMCALHRRLWDANSSFEEAELGLKMIAPFKAILDEFGCPPLTEAMEDARVQLKIKADHARANVEAAREAFDE